MKILIDMDDNLYTRLFDNGIDNYADTADIVKAIRKGTVLPDKHIDSLDISDRDIYYKAVIDLGGKK